MAAELSREGEAHRRYQPGVENNPSWYGAGRMQPIFLDGISVAFPELQIIGAHLGYGLYDSAAAVARWRRNVYFDISGGTVVRRHLLDRHMLRSEVSTRKLVWGSDCDMAHMSRELSAWMAAFDDDRPVGGGAGPHLLGHRRAHFRLRGLTSIYHASTLVDDQRSAPTLWFAAARADRAMHPGFQHRQDDGPVLPGCTPAPTWRIGHACGRSPSRPTACTAWIERCLTRRRGTAVADCRTLGCALRRRAE